MVSPETGNVKLAGLVVATVAKVDDAVGLSWTIYSVKAEPPLDVGAVQDRETAVLVAVPVRFWGAVETVTELQAEPVGVMVKISELLGWVIVSVSTPPEQLWVTTPPLPIVEDAIARGEVKTKGPPVVEDILTTIFPALTTTWSALEPASTVRFIAGEVKAKVALELNVTGAGERAEA